MKSDSEVDVKFAHEKLREQPMLLVHCCAVAIAKCTIDSAILFSRQAVAETNVEHNLKDSFN